MSKDEPVGGAVKAVSRRDALAGLLAGTAVLQAVPAQSAGISDGKGQARSWTTAWSATLQRQATPEALIQRTVRHTLVCSVGGPRLRVRLSNEFGSQPLQIGALTVSVEGRTVPVTFAGQRSVTVPAMAPLSSDPVDCAVKPLQAVQVSMYLPGPCLPETFQRGHNGMSVTTGSGDFTNDPRAPGSDGPVMFLSALEVQGRQPCLVVLGDTKSAGPGNWVEFLPSLAAGRMAIANRSMYAGLMALGAPGTSVLSRFDRDVLSVSGATHVLVYSGNNDLIQPGLAGSNGQIMMEASLALPVETLIAHQQQAIDRARAAGLGVVGGTWLPYAGVAIAGYSTPEKLAKRDRLNAWMRDARPYDALIDFDAALRDPENPQQLLPAFDSGNHFTPSAAGYRRMAEVAWPVLRKLKA